MKKIFVFLTVCLVLLAGCTNSQPSVNQHRTNNNGTQAVNVTDSTQAANAADNTQTGNVTDSTQTGNAADSTPQDSENVRTNHDIPIEVASGDVVEIKEKLFIAQTNDIYYNAGDYLGKTIKYEGIFDVYVVPETDARYYTVIRYGPGCCGIDANAGFEVLWDDAYPEQNDWVEAVGVLEEYEEEGYKYLRLALTSLTVLPARGAEYVSQ